MFSSQTMWLSVTQQDRLLQRSAWPKRKTGLGVIGNSTSDAEKALEKFKLTLSSLEARSRAVQGKRDGRFEPIFQRYASINALRATNAGLSIGERSSCASLFGPRDMILSFPAGRASSGFDPNP